MENQHSSFLVKVVNNNSDDLRVKFAETLREFAYTSPEKGGFVKVGKQHKSDKI